MAQFTIFDNHRKPYYPNQMEPKEKRELRERCIRERLNLYCRCNEQNEYGIRDKTWAIYPKSKTQVHKDWCPKSESYKRSMIYNKGFKINEKTGQINVYLSEPISEKKKKNTKDNIPIVNKPGTNSRKYPSTQQGKITISAMIKKMNMETFRHVAFSSSDEKYPSADAMCRKAFPIQKKMKIGIGKRRKFLGDLNIESDKCRFIYYMLKELPNIKGKKDTDTVYLVSTEKKKTEGYCQHRVKVEVLKAALKEYKDTYSTDNMDGKKIAFAGFVNQSGIYILRFILVSDFGLFSESENEVEMYNAICQIINENDYKKRGVHFYKPYEYGYGAYADKYLEDGIIEFDNTNKKIIIEVYGRTDDAYLEKKKIKEQILSAEGEIYKYIPWEAYSGEELPKDVIRQTIEDLLNERGNEV